MAAKALVSNRISRAYRRVPAYRRFISPEDHSTGASMAQFLQLRYRNSILSFIGDRLAINRQVLSFFV